MCSLIILFRPEHPWPVLLAANRDEMASRPWRAPAEHWPDRSGVTAGLDLLSGGSWMGINRQGLAVCVLNRMGSLGPAAGKRSRGELVLEALDHATAAEAAEALSFLEARSYRSFNLVLADQSQALWLRNKGGKTDRIEVLDIPHGLSMITARDLNDTSSPRIARFLPAFRDALPPDPDTEDWSEWEALQATTDPADPLAGLNVATDGEFGTLSASLLALPSRPRTLAEVPRLPIWRFAAGPPDKVAFETLQLTAD
ncbi:MAG: NRDE family protein [Rhodospirillales bacterium]